MDWTLCLLCALVSTLAVHGKRVPAVSNARNGCEGKAFCDQKPVDYPQEEIDRLVLRNLTLLHRAKRESAVDMPKVVELEPGDTSGNCVVEREMKTPYTLQNENLVPQIIVQSDFFKQEIPYVMCKTVGPCFQDLIRDGSNIETSCKQKWIRAVLFIYDDDENYKGITPIKTDIPIDCVCTKK